MGAPRTFKERPITKETLALGIGGQIHRGDGFPELPPESRVKFTAYADYETVKYKFLDGGKVEEILILTVEAKSFEVLSIEEKPIQDELPGTGGEPEPKAVPKAAAKTKRGGGRGRGGLSAVKDET